MPPSGLVNGNRRDEKKSEPRVVCRSAAITAPRRFEVHRPQKTGGGLVVTVMLTGADVTVAPVLSVATAVRL